MTFYRNENFTYRILNSSGRKSMDGSLEELDSCEIEVKFSSLATVDRHLIRVNIGQIAESLAA